VSIPQRRLLLFLAFLVRDLFSIRDKDKPRLEKKKEERRSREFY
jgi:hypothetical protein